MSQDDYKISEDLFQVNTISENLTQESSNLLSERLPQESFNVLLEGSSQDIDLDDLNTVFDDNLDLQEDIEFIDEPEILDIEMEKK
ncbi:289_t:CDS:2 [Cetraspora pellucida]|uniref:289_t:CDS:1 n=1 Tax=Cetraspora pellucida TaxID=1433469 RepID=A0A9N9CMQ8_9GLOM|nr:289_t:CDS:2 [Cetraspora pellucida]